MHRGPGVVEVVADRAPQVFFVAVAVLKLEAPLGPAIVHPPRRDVGEIRRAGWLDGRDADAPLSRHR